MGMLDRFRSRSSGPGAVLVLVSDPRFDDWDVVRDFSDLDTARAFRQALEEAGIESVLTSDWPLDRTGRGDIALRVPPGSWSEAEELLSGLE
jgi:hypothetical protein